MRTSGFDLSRLRTQIKPFRLHWFPRLRSTNDHAAALRKRGELFAPAMVLTGCQLAGRGRGSHTWWSGPGCLTVTFVIPIEEHLAPHQVLEHEAAPGHGAILSQPPTESTTLA